MATMWAPLLSLGTASLWPALSSSLWLRGRTRSDVGNEFSDLLLSYITVLHFTCLAQVDKHAFPVVN